MKIMPVQKQTRAGQRTRFKVRSRSRSGWRGQRRLEAGVHCARLAQKQVAARRSTATRAGAGASAVVVSRLWRGGAACGAEAQPQRSICGGAGRQCSRAPGCWQLRKSGRQPGARQRKARTRSQAQAGGSPALPLVATWHAHPPSAALPCCVAGLCGGWRLQRPLRPGREVRQGGGHRHPRCVLLRFGLSAGFGFLGAR